MMPSTALYVPAIIKKVPAMIIKALKPAFITQNALRGAFQLS